MITGAARCMMRHVQESSMQHVCRIEPYIVAEDGTVSYGKPFDTVCGFKANSGSLSGGSMYETVEADAELRLPLDVTIGMKDRVTILAAYGETVASRVYQVSALPDSFGPSGQVVQLQEIYS